jgi:3-deoxy-manno-octulosonate cytidylyltransferase (CMP-KDO synthetase)
MVDEPPMTTVTALAVIPARYGSERFPGKPLALISGVPMVVRVLRNVADASRLTAVLVATDDARIADVVLAAGGDVAMTDPDLPSGSHRVWAAAADRSEDIIVNVQGDEPLLPGRVVDALVEQLVADHTCDIATPVIRIPRLSAMAPDVVTVARDDTGRALYFSREVIPHGADSVWRHVGVYAYRRDALRRYVQSAPTELERVEKLEQLRALSIGLRIAAVEVDVVAHAVDRPEDILSVEAALEGRNPASDLSSVRLVVLDVDGVLTDGRISYQGEADQLLSFDVKDGFGIVALRRAGIHVAIISSRDSAALHRRAAELGITEVRTSVDDKGAELLRLVEHLGVPLSSACYVGDDAPDLPPMKLAGLSAAPADAMSNVRAAATIKLERRGGHGAVRELADLLLRHSGAAPAD